MKPGLVIAKLVRCAQLLDVIVRPGDHDFCPEIEEAQLLLGYKQKIVAKPNSKALKRGKRLNYWQRLEQKTKT